ncbi:MAG: DUF6340 family protein [Bacteroidales bacterium]|jgi:hypothetical protein|nr:DUF6340 family protein [Bacteroidales bacterium]
MKYRFNLLILGVVIIVLSSCQPYTSLQIETIIPAKVEFPGNFNKIVFVNFATDINHDGEIDTVLYKMITEEMSLGFMDAIQTSVGVDSTNFLYVKGFPVKNDLYKLDTISWQYLEKISDVSKADIFIVLDSINMSMESDLYKEYNTYPNEYYKYRELAVNIYWSLFDLIEKKRLDNYYYKDTLLWDASSYLKADLERKMPSVERSIRETSYFAAADYAGRIFPGWRSETRYFFSKGNKDFVLAAQFISDSSWEEALDLWKKYTDDVDKEIASRACFNLAFYNELSGNIDLAIAWAQKSKDIKNKTKTRYYISLLKTRKKDLEKLQKQIY